MADKHIADKESQFVAVNGPPDFCIVGKECIPFDITDKLSNARDPSSNVYARGVPVLTQGTRINTVDGDAGKGVASGCSKGHTIVLSGSNTVFTNGKPTAFHLSKVCMNCNGADVPNTTGELRTTAVAPKPQWGTKDKGQELKDQNKANNEALHNNPNGKTQEEARALQSKVNQTFADATRHEKAAMDALRSGGGVDVYAESIQTSTNARNMLAEAERQVRFANPTSKAMAEVLVSQLPGSGLVDAGKDFAQAGQQAGQGNYLSAAGSAVMGVFGVVTEAPGLKQIKGVFKGGKAIDKLGDAKKAADLKKAQDAEQARQSGVVIDRKNNVPGPCDHLRQGSGTGPYRGGAHSKTSQPVNDGKDSHHAPAKDASPLPHADGPAIQMDPADHRRTTSNGNNGKQGAAYRKMLEGLLKEGKWREAMAIEIKDIRRIARELGDLTKLLK
jgi:uncharacterized Zn-binding protein involved in type VI secretion